MSSLRTVALRGVSCASRIAYPGFLALQAVAAILRAAGNRPELAAKRVSPHARLPIR